MLKTISLIPFANQLFNRSKDGEKSQLFKEVFNSDLMVLAEVLNRFKDKKYAERKEFCKTNQLSMKSLVQSMQTYQDLEKEIQHIQKQKKEEFSDLFKKDETMALEPIDVRIAKCFFSSFFNNLSMPLQISKGKML